MFAREGYVGRCHAALEADLTLSILLANLSRNGWTSSDLLTALKTDQAFGAAVAGAQIISWNIGGNDPNRVRTIYKTRSCGGADNHYCLRSAIAAFKLHWDGILAEIMAFRARNNALLVTMDLYNPYVAIDLGADTWANDGGRSDFQVFQLFFAEANSYIAATTAERGVLVARIAPAFNGDSGVEGPRVKGYIAAGGLHPSDGGHGVIADVPRRLGSEPLRLPRAARYRRRSPICNRRCLCYHSASAMGFRTAKQGSLHEATRISGA